MDECPTMNFLIECLTSIWVMCHVYLGSVTIYALSQASGWVAHE